MDRKPVGLGALVQAGDAVNRYAATLLIVLVVAGLVACGSASDDPAQQRVEKPAQVAPQEK